MSRPNYSAVRLALLHHLDLSEGQGLLSSSSSPPPLSSGRQISSLLFRASHWQPVLMILDREARTFADQQRCVNCPSYQINLLCGAFVEDRPASASWSLAGPCFTAAGCGILNCPHVILVSWWIWSHICKKQMEAKGWILYSLTTRNPVEQVTICADVTLAVAIEIQHSAWIYHQGACWFQVLVE